MYTQNNSTIFQGIRCYISLNFFFYPDFIVSYSFLLENYSRKNWMVGVTGKEWEKIYTWKRNPLSQKSSVIWWAFNLFSFKKYSKIATISIRQRWGLWLVWLSWLNCSANGKVTSSIPGPVTYLGYGSVPGWGWRYERQPIAVSLPLSPSLALSKNQ